MPACALQVVDIKGEPFLSGIDLSAAFLSKKFSQHGMSLVTLLIPRCVHMP